MDVPFTFSCQIELSEYSIQLPELRIFRYLNVAADNVRYIHWIYNDYKLASSHDVMYSTEISSSGNAMDWILVIPA